IGLVAADNVFGKLFASKLNTAVVIAKLHLCSQNEIGKLASLVNKEGVLFDFYSLRGANNYTVSHLPETGVAFPTVECLSIEKRLKSGLLRECEDWAEQEEEEKISIHESSTHEY